MFGTVCGNNVAPATLQLFYHYTPTNLWTGKMWHLLFTSLISECEISEGRNETEQIPFFRESSVSMLSYSVA